ncbi:MAG: ABC transporter permease [Alicyclobacillus sp.]|nr:ABC transporter permease [Alicyclobacillus sp.]
MSTSARTWLYIGRRIVSMFVTLCLLIVIANLVVFFVPGGMYSTLASNHIPFYFSSLWSTLWNSLQGVLTLNLQSSGLPTFMVVHAILTTFLLTFCSLILAMLIGIPAGIFAALYPRNWFSRIITSFSVLVSQVPPFDMAAFLIVIFAIWIPILPAGGWGKPADVVLPMAALVLLNLGYTTKYMQAGLSDVIQRGFITSARARGLSSFEVIVKHALRPSLLNLLALFGPQVGLTAIYCVSNELAFSIPGVGYVLGMKSMALGIPDVMKSTQQIGVTYIATIGFFVIILNFIVDLAQRLLDPRFR